MNYNEVFNLICKEYENQTTFSKDFDNTCATKDKLKAVTLIIEKYLCDFDTASIICNYFIDGTPLPSSLSPSEIAHNNAIAQDWQNKPKCPTCNSTNLKKVSTASKAVNTAVFGLLGTKRFKQFHCNNCGYEW